MENGHAELTRLLLSYGADPTLSTYSGQRPADLTTDTVCFSLLQQHLRDITAMEGAYWDFAGPARCMGKSGAMLYRVGGSENNIQIIFSSLTIFKN